MFCARLRLDMGTYPKLSLPGSIFQFQLLVSNLKILSHTNGSLRFFGMLQVVFNIHVEVGNYYNKSTFIMTNK